MVLNSQQKKWFKSLEKIINNIPDGIELIVNYNECEIVPTGTIKKLEGLDMIGAGSNILYESQLDAFRIDQNKMHANS